MLDVLQGPASPQAKVVILAAYFNGGEIDRAVLNRQYQLSEPEVNSGFNEAQIRFEGRVKSETYPRVLRLGVSYEVRS